MSNRPHQFLSLAIQTKKSSKRLRGTIFLRILIFPGPSPTPLGPLRLISAVDSRLPIGQALLPHRDAISQNCRHSHLLLPSDSGIFLLFTKSFFFQKFENLIPLYKEIYRKISVSSKCMNFFPNFHSNSHEKSICFTYFPFAAHRMRNFRDDAAEIRGR